MFTKIDKKNEKFFQELAEDSFYKINSLYPETVVILHPGAKIFNDSNLPFKAENPDDDPLSEDQTKALESILCSTFDIETKCCIAVYTGYLREEEYKNMLNQGGTRYSERLNYILFEGNLINSLFTPVKRKWDPFLFLELSFLWSKDRSWVIASTPDTAFTVIGCKKELAQILLNSTVLDAIKWPVKK